MPNAKCDILVRPPYFIPETKKISEVLKDLRDNKSHMAIVIDEYGGTAGILTLEDIIEEIIGDVMDEYDAEEKLIVEHEDGSISVNARLDVEELGRPFERGTAGWEVRVGWGLGDQSSGESADINERLTFQRSRDGD